MIYVLQHINSEGSDYGYYETKLLKASRDKSCLEDLRDKLIAESLADQARYQQEVLSLQERRIQFEKECEQFLHRNAHAIRGYDVALDTYKNAWSVSCPEDAVLKFKKSTVDQIVRSGGLKLFYNQKWLNNIIDLSEVSEEPPSWTGPLRILVPENPTIYDRTSLLIEEVEEI